MSTYQGPSDDPYKDHDPDSFNRPVELPIRIAGWPQPPFRIYLTKFKSGSPEALSFFLDPRSWMRGETWERDGEPVPVSPEPLDGVHEGTRVSSFIINHEATLKRKVIYTMTVVDSTGDQVGTVTYKDSG